MMKSHLPKFGAESKKKIHIFKRALKIILPFSTLCKAGIFYPSTKTTYHNRMNTEAEYHLSSIKPDIKEICKNVKQCQSSH